MRLMWQAEGRSCRVSKSAIKLLVFMKHFRQMTDKIVIIADITKHTHKAGTEVYSIFSSKLHSNPVIWVLLLSWMELWKQTELQ